LFPKVNKISVHNVRVTCNTPLNLSRFLYRFVTMHAFDRETDGQNSHG